MSYKILYNDEIIYDPFSDEIVLDPKLTAETNAAHYFDFTISPKHNLYEKIKERDGIVSVYSDKKKLFSGYISEIKDDFDGYKDVTCVGVLDYLGDTLVRPYSTIKGEQDLTAPSSFDGYFQWLIDQHNKHVLDSRKRFKIGVNQAGLLDKNNYIYRSSTQLPTTASEIENKILDYGGYLSVRYENTTNILDFYADAHESNTQIIDFGVNLIDFKRTSSTDKQYTAVRPMGATPQSNGSGKQEKPITIASLPDGGTSYSDITKWGDVVYSISGVQRYGYREYSYSNTDITTQSYLLDAACVQLQKLLSPSLTLDIQAVDMALFVEGFDHLDIGQAVRVRSKPHNIDEYLMVTSIDLDLQDPGNTEYTLGVTYDTLTGQQSAYLKSLNSSVNSSLDSIAALDQATKDAAKDAKDANEKADQAKTDAVNASAKADEAKNTADSTKTELTSAINNISIGGRNLARKTSNDWSEWVTPKANATNIVVSSGSTIYFPSEINVGDEYYIQCEIEFDNVTPSDGKRSYIALQGSVDGKWEANKFNPWNKGIYDIKNGVLKISDKKTSKVKPTPPEVYADCAFRVDSWATGRYRWRRIKVESGNKPTDWSPAPEDIINDAKTEAIDGINIGGRNLFYLTKDTPIAKSNEGKKGRNYNSYNSIFGSGGSLTKTADGLKLIFGSNSEVSIQVPLAEFGNVENNDIVTLSFTYRGNITSFGEFYFLQKISPNIFVRVSSTLNADESWHKYSCTFSSSQANIRTCVSCLLFYNNKRYDNSKWIEIKAGTLKLEKGNKATDWSPAPEDLVAESIIKTDEEYYNSVSPTELSGGKWQRKNVWEDGKYVWNRSLITYGDNTTKYSPSETGICISGNTGVPGEKGTDGKMLYATSSTESNVGDKIATLSSGEIVLTDGLTVSVTFTNGNTAESPTLNINSTGAKSVYTNGVQFAYWTAGATVVFVYASGNWYSASTPVYANTATIGNPAGKNVYIDSDSVDIREGSVTNSSFSSNKISLGNNSKDIAISMRNDHLLIDTHDEGYDDFGDRKVYTSFSDKLSSGLIIGNYNYSTDDSGKTTNNRGGKIELSNYTNKRGAVKGPVGVVSLTAFARSGDKTFSNDASIQLQTEISEDEVGDSGLPICYPRVIIQGDMEINGEPLADFVTTQATKNGWYYRVWKSGHIEGWMHFTHNTGKYTWWNNDSYIKYGYTAVPSKTLPVTLKSLIYVNARVECSTYSGLWLVSDKASWTTSKSSPYWICCAAGNADSPDDVTIYLHFVGTI